MRDDLKEPIGFLCRWSLLAVAAGILAAGAWAGALAADKAASDVDAVMVVPDAVLASWAKMKWRGCVDPPAMPGLCTALSYRPGGPAIFALTYGKWIYLQVDRPHCGVNRITIKGTPYGAFAYQRIDALLCIISAETDVFLLDARMAWSVEDLDQLPGCLEELRRRGQPVFIHAGTTRKFVEVRRRLRKLESSTPVVWEIMTKPQTFKGITYFANRLGRSRPGRPKPFLVTADVALARLADEDDFLTYLIAPPPEKALSGTIHRLESLAKFKEYLAGQPISQ